MAIDRVFRTLSILTILLWSFVSGRVLGAADSTILRYCIHPEWMPYEAIRNGEHVGISKDYLDIISLNSGIEFNFVATDSWPATLDAITEGKCDALPLFDSASYSGETLAFSDGYFSTPYVLVSRTDDDVIPGYSAIASRTLGVVSGSIHAAHIARFYPEMNVYYVEDEKHGLTLLKQKDIDLMVGALLSVNVLINNYFSGDFIISGYAEPQVTFSIAILNQYAHLMPRLNTAISAISENKAMEVYKRWYQVKPVSRQENVWIILLINILLIYATILGWIRKNQTNIKRALLEKDENIKMLQTALTEKSRAIEFLTTHDELTNLHNRNFMVQKVDEEISRFKRFPSPVTLLVIGVSNIDQIFREFGQDRADDIMRELATITLDNSRETDIAARWANDEIILLCPQTSADSAKTLAGRILTEVELRSLNLFDGIKVSLGGASLQKGDSFAQWFDRAQQALNNSKKQKSHGFESV